MVVRDSQDRFVGPFGILLHMPAAGEAFLQLGHGIGTIPDVPAECRETVILVVGARTGAKYEN